MTLVTPGTETVWLRCHLRAQPPGQSRKHQDEHLEKQCRTPTVVREDVEGLCQTSEHTPHTCRSVTLDAKRGLIGYISAAVALDPPAAPPARPPARSGPAGSHRSPPTAGCCRGRRPAWEVQGRFVFQIHDYQVQERGSCFNSLLSSARTWIFLILMF